MNLKRINQYKYIVALIFSTGLTALLNFIVQIYVARNSSSEIFGIFSIYNSILLMALPLLTVGMGHFFIKKYSEILILDKRIDINSLILILISSFCGFILLNVFFNFYYKSVSWLIILLLSFGVLGYAYHELIQSYFVGIQNKKKLIIWQPYLHIVRFFSVVIVVIFFEKINFNGLALFSIIFSLFICISIYIIKDKIFDFRVVNLSRTVIISNFKESFWFGLVGFLYILYSQVNILYVGKYLSAEMAGYFNIGHTFVLLSLIIPNTIYYKFLLPKLHYFAKNDVEKLNGIYKFGSFISFISGCFVLFFIYTYSDLLISLIYGEKFLIANDIFKKIILSIPFFYLSIHLGVFSYLGRNQKYKVLVLTIVTLFSLILNYVMVVKFGVEGSALSLSIVVLLMTVLYAFINYFFVFKKLSKGV